MEDLDQMPHSLASDLGLHCLSVSHKTDQNSVFIKRQLDAKMTRVGSHLVSVRIHCT